MDAAKLQLLQRLAYTPDSFRPGCRRLLLSADFLGSAERPLMADTVYIAEAPSELYGIPADGEDIFLICCFDEEDADSAALAARQVTPLFFGSDTSPSELREALAQTLQKNHTVAQLSWELLQAGHRNSSIQQLVALAQRYVKNTIAVFDPGFQMIAFKGTPDPNAERWMHQHYLSREDIERVNSNNIHERARKSPVPMLIQNRHFKFDRIIAMLDHDRDLGHVVIIEDQVPFTGQDYQIAGILCNSIRQQMMKDEFTRNAQGFPHEYFLRDLLDQRLVTTPQTLQHSEFLQQRFSSDCCCLVVDTARTTGALPLNLIRNGFEQFSPGTSTVSYQGHIVVIFSGISSRGISREKLEQLRAYCVENRLYCGMSNTFSSILDLPGYYNQALRAIEIGTGASNDPDLFCYQDHFIRHLLNAFLQQEDVSTFCCPQIKQLMESDKKDGRNLAETLYQYLLNGNTAATASALFIHRNTLLYRLNLINELVTIDYNDPVQRLYLILSYEMMRAGQARAPVEQKQL